MKLSVSAFAFTAAIVGAAAMLVTAVIAMLTPSWGEPMMAQLGVVAPGVTGANFRSLLLVVFYAAVDGIVLGALFAWLYNRLAASFGDRAPS